MRSAPSIRPIHVRQDLASLPWIAIHTKALWIPLLITIGEHGRRHRARRADRSRSSCSRTSSRRRPSAASSSRASWRHGRAGCSGVVVGLVVGGLLRDPRHRLPDDDLPGLAADLGSGPRHRRSRRSSCRRSSVASSPPAPRGTAASLPTRARTVADRRTRSRPGPAGRRPHARLDLAEGRRQALTVAAGSLTGSSPTGHGNCLPLRGADSRPR